MSIPQVDEFVEKHWQHSGYCIGPKTVEEQILVTLKDQATERGLSTENITVRLGLVSEYYAIVKSHPRTRLTESAVSKTSSRFTAENYLIGAARNMLCLTHILVNIEGANIPKDPFSLAGMVSRASGEAPVHVLDPAYITSKDDSTIFLFKGKAPSRGADMSRCCDSAVDSSTHGMCTNPRKKTVHCNGVRVRGTYSFCVKERQHKVR